MGCATKIKEMKNPSQDGHPSPHIIPKHLDRIPNAEPIVEPLSKYGNRFKKNSTNTYVALKKKYAVMQTSRGYKAKGKASWYGTKFQGKRTSSGEAYDMFAMTAAHRTLPLPTYAKVTNIDNGKSIIVKVNDRGPFHNDRLIDLSYVAAHKLGILGRGTGRVEVESVDPRDHHGKIKNNKGHLFNRNRLAKNTIQTENTKNIDSTQVVMPEVAVQTIQHTKPESKMTKKEPIQNETLKQALVKNSVKNTPAKGQVFLQLGSFNQKNNAEDLAKKVGQFCKQPTKIAENNTEIGAKYRVRIGPFKNREEAISLSQKLVKKEFPKSIVLAE